MIDYLILNFGVHERNHVKFSVYKELLSRIIITDVTLTLSSSYM
jgi:hypothetical protein